MSRRGGRRSGCTPRMPRRATERRRRRPRPAGRGQRSSAGRPSPRTPLTGRPAMGGRPRRPQRARRPVAAEAPLAVTSGPGKVSCVKQQVCDPAPSFGAPTRRVRAVTKRGRSRLSAAAAYAVGAPRVVAGPGSRSLWRSPFARAARPRTSPSTEARHDPPVALRLIYRMLVTLACRPRRCLLPRGVARSGAASTRGPPGRGRGSPQRGSEEPGVSCCPGWHPE